MTVHPSREAFVASARPGELIPVWIEFRADLETPVSAYLKIAERFPLDHFLLESVEGGEKWARYSFIGFDPYVRFEASGNRVTFQRGASREERTVPGDPLSALTAFLGGMKYHPSEGLPRLSGGAVGYIGYDYVRHIERIPETHSRTSAAPDALFLLPSRLVIFDNVRHTILVVAHSPVGGDERPEDVYDACLERIAEVRRLLDAPFPWKSVPDGTDGADEPPFEICLEDFASSVIKAKEYIRNGDIIQVVLSNRAKIRTRRSPAEIYRILRAVNPSPYMFLLNFGELCVVGASPEVLVRLEGDTVHVRPIAGTRKRGATLDEDRRMETELLSDPKEIAEHVMLVDLGRNDVGRVSEWGTVRVDELMVVERYSHVMHIVSNVTGRLRKGGNALEVLRAAFPAGTVAGAPKVRAMEIIEELEPFRRGIYAGAVGYFDLQGNMDFCIAIRTIVVDNGEAIVQAGAGIVADSDPLREWEEIRSKARVLFRAVGESAGEDRP